LNDLTTNEEPLDSSENVGSNQVEPEVEVVPERVEPAVTAAPVKSSLPPKAPQSRASPVAVSWSHSSTSLAVYMWQFLKDPKALFMMRLFKIQP
jgi:hypothetical protein